MPEPPSKAGLSEPERPISPERMAQVPRLHWGLYERMREGKSRKAAVRCFCLECMAWSAKEVERCTARDCPLWRWRVTG